MRTADDNTSVAISYLSGVVILNDTSFIAISPGDALFTAYRGTRCLEPQLFRGDERYPRMMRVRLPGRPVAIISLVAPGGPALARAAREKL
jgi:hypothetical protein